MRISASAPAVIDGACAVLGSVGVGVTLLVLSSAGSVANIAGLIAGLTLVAGAALSVLRRRPAYYGPADRITLMRAVLAGGCATLVVLALLDELPARSWWLLLLAGPALVLDAVDGAVARRTNSASGAGARMDMELDAALLLVLSVPAAMVVGYWVLLIGLMRYLFVAASWLRPALRAELPFSQLRRVIAAVQGIALFAALIPLVPVPAAVVFAAAALALLCFSFGRDVLALERAAVNRAVRLA